MKRLICFVLCISLTVICGCASEIDGGESSEIETTAVESNESSLSAASEQSDDSLESADSFADSSEELSEEGQEDEEWETEYFLNGFSYTVREGSATVTSYQGKESELTVPTDFDGFEVVAIGNGAFKNNAFVEELKVSDGVLSIGENAFVGCKKLRKLSIGKDVAFIGGGAFDDCACLEVIEVSGLNPNFTTKSGILYDKELTRLLRCPQAFEKTELAVPETVTAIDAYAFYYCSSLKKLSLHEGVSEIGEGAFYYCRSLEGLTLPSQVSAVKDFLCFGCLALDKVLLPDGLLSIGEYAFFGCTSLEELSFPEGVSVAATSFEGSSLNK